MKFWRATPNDGTFCKNLSDLCADRYFMASIILAVSARVAVFLAIMWFPVPNESGLWVSPLHYQTGTDFWMHEATRRILFESDLENIMSIFRDWMFDTSNNTVHIFRPILPFILQITDYTPSNTLPLATLYLCISVIWVLTWMLWLRRHSLNRIWIAIFGLLPVPIWFTVNISTDLVFAVFVGGFILNFEKRKWTWVLIFLILGVLTRPNGLSLALFSAAYFALMGGNLNTTNRLALVLAFTVIAMALLPFVWNDLYHFAVGSEQDLILGFTQANFLHGIYTVLPVWLDVPLSWVSLLAVKISFVVGLRPSFSDTADFLVIVRGAAGLILLPGLFMAFVLGPNWIRLLLVCFMFPIFLGLSQERYILPVLPILYYYGAQSLQHVYGSLRSIKGRVS